MEQRDILRDEIEQVGKVLGQILSDFLRIKAEEKAAQAIEISNENFQNKLGIDIEQFMKLNKADLKANSTQLELTSEHIEVIADYLVEIGQVKSEESSVAAKLYFEQALMLLDVADEIANMVYWDRINKKTKIKHLIQKAS